MIIKFSRACAGHNLVYYRKQSVEMNTNFKCLFCGQCDNNRIRYKILYASLQQKFNFICIVRSAYHKLLWKGQNVNIDHPPSTSETILTVLADPCLPQTVPRRQFVERNLSLLDVIWMKCFSSGFSFFGLSDFGRTPSNTICHKRLVFLISIC